MSILKNFLVIIVLSVIAIPSSAFAFCGFYVGGAGAEMFADATQVVLLRDGTRTVLSMQNRYQGPLENFAMVIPVSEVIMQDQVKTLSPELFKKVDTMSSPRLVEYWEEDPCQPDYYKESANINNGTSSANNASTNNGVVVEAEFEVGEYEITVLSTTESSALETWLTGNGFALPTGAATYLEPYVQSGDYFFAAKVNVDKVTFDSEGKAVLSPLRFHMDSDDFELPIRLGMVNSNGKQDLIVYILGADGQRYELENYPNVTIPTNIRVVNDVRNDFPAFYRSVFSRTVKENPGAAITEYSWDASSCDPCPGPVIDQGEILTLGGDVVPEGEFKQWALTRIHLQYAKDEIGEDLVFKKADPIAGGREIYNGDTLETGSVEHFINNFQARYIIRHPWTGAVECDEPTVRWGYPDTSTALSANSSGGDAFSPGTENIDELVIGNVPEIEIVGTGKAPVGTTNSGQNGNNNGSTGDTKASGGCSAVDSGKSFAFIFLLGLFLFRKKSKKE